MSLNYKYLLMYFFHVPGERVFVHVVGCGQADKPHDLAELLFMSYIFGSLLSSVWLTFHRKMPFWNSKWTTPVWGLTPARKGKGWPVWCLAQLRERDVCVWSWAGSLCSVAFPLSVLYINMLHTIQDFGFLTCPLFYFLFFSFPTSSWGIYPI